MKLLFVEINGIKLEMDLRTARRIDTFKVGDNVKVLRKTYSGHEILSGVIADFVNFKELPTMVIAVFKEGSYGSAPNVEFIYYNSKADETNPIEVMQCSDNELKVSKDRVIDQFKTAIEKKKNEYLELETKLEYFVRNFGITE